nr:D-xylose ABC transporter substrate-binding protein [Paenibacillus soyae]
MSSAALILALAIAGCEAASDRNNDSAPSGRNEAISGENVVIGMSLATLQEERWLKDRDIFIAAAEALGAEVQVQAANSNSARQIAQAENMISQGVDVLVIVPHDAAATAVIVEKAHAAGIKVMSYDRLIKDADVDLYVSFDNERVGEMQAEAIVSLVPEGSYAYIGGADSDNNAHLFKQGAFHILQPLIDNGSIRIVYDQFTEDWVPDNARESMEEALLANGRIDAVIAANDGMAGGVIQALTDQGLQGSIPVSGQDAELAALQRIVAGTQAMTVYKPIKKLAERAAELAVRLALNEPVATDKSVHNGKGNVPAILLDPVMVDRTSIDETVVKDGFHKREEIYAGAE